MKKGICIKCSGSRVSLLNTYDGGESAGGDLNLVHFQHPENWLFKGRTFFKMEAYACFDCGYVEFYMKPGEADKLAKTEY